MKGIAIALWIAAALAFAAMSHASLEDLGITVNGFVDARGGARLQNDPDADELSLMEARLQLDGEWMGDLVTIHVRSDLLLDAVAEEKTVNLDLGTGFLDLREANAEFSPASFADVKVGRQILTWGTGDLLFINDLFPKDWQSFFAGRHEEYLKAPSDALFVGLYPGFVDIHLAYMPRFDPDRFIRGERISYWSPLIGARAGEDMIVDPSLPDEWFSDDEAAARMSRNIGGYEVEAYFYDGRWKSPRGMDPATGRAAFPKLTVYGASARGGVGKGLANLEIGYYDSRDDADGVDPLVPNSEWRFLAGYERELARDFSGGVQYYVEWMQDYDDYRQTLPGGPAADEDRHVVTLRLTRQAMNQALVLSLFGYWYPTDEDGYVRPGVKYKATDNWLLTAGANVFFGEQDHTFFGQFEKNTNLYGGARYSF